jgi:dipeptidyl-peptidase-4
MTLHRFVLGFGGVVLAGSLALAAPPSDLAGRYARYDLYSPYTQGSLSALITDLDMAANFDAADEVLFRRGPKGAGSIILLDPSTRGQRIIATEPDLASKLAKLGVTGADASPIRPQSFDPKTNQLKLSAAGQSWLYDVVTSKISNSPPEPASAGVVSPDGRLKILARNYNLYAVELATGREIALTVDGVYDKRYGVNYPMLGDLVAADSETPDQSIAVEWSQDSTRIATYRLSRNDAYIWHTVQQNPPGSRFPRSFSYVYPTAGAKDLPQVEPIVIDVASALKARRASIVELKVPAEALLYPSDPDISWDHGHVVYQWTKRGYAEQDLFEADPTTGEASLRVHEEVKPVVTVTSSSIHDEPDLNGYLSISERSGWAQLYYLRRGDSPSGGRPLTQGAWEVDEIAHTDGAGGSILITGTGREPGVNPYFHSLYSVTLDGRLTDLTPEPLDHRIVVSDDGKWFIDRMSSPTTPTRTLVRSARDGHIVVELGRADPTALLATGFTPPEPFQTLANDGKTVLYAMIYRPAHFDPARSYPVIENVYTGPTTHRYAEAYDGNVVSTTNALAQIGAIIVTIDGRGTSQRGQAFRLPAFQNLGEVGLDDHIWVLKAMKSKYPYFDLNRVGVYGGSAGGYDAARFILRRPEVYKAAFAQSGNHDLRLDKAWWPEVSMGLADDATWERNSNIPIAGGLKGKLLLIHGDIDDNVPITASLRLSQALQEAGKLHELVIVPNTRHNVGATPVYHQKLRNFFVRNLLGETPPS